MDWFVFVVAGALAIAGALGVVLSRNPVHAALMLVMSLLAVAVLFVEQKADFLAAVQVIVYAGAIVVLFLFVIMLIGVDRPESLTVEPLRGQRPFAAFIGVAAFAELFFLVRLQGASGRRASAGSLTSGHESNVERLARPLFTHYLLPFELTSALLVVAVVGAVALSRRERAVTVDEGEGEG